MTRKIQCIEGLRFGSHALSLAGVTPSQELYEGRAGSPKEPREGEVDAGGHDVKNHSLHLLFCEISLIPSHWPFLGSVYTCDYIP